MANTVITCVYQNKKILGGWTITSVIQMAECIYSVQFGDSETLSCFEWLHDSPFALSM